MDKDNKNELEPENLIEIAGGDLLIDIPPFPTDPILPINPIYPPEPGPKKMKTYKCKKCGAVAHAAQHIILSTCFIGGCGGKMELIN